MEKKKNERAAAKLSDEFQALVLLKQITDYSNVDLPWVSYLREISKNLIEFSKCDSLELHIKEKGKENSCEVIKRTNQSFHFKTIYFISDKNEENLPNREFNPNFERFYKDTRDSKIDPSLPFFTRNGSFWTGDIENTLMVYPGKKINTHYYSFKIDKNYRSIAIIPIKVGNHRMGILQFMCREKDFFIESEIEFYENFVLILGLVLLNQRSQAALTERVKEMTCLYGIAHAFERHGTSLEKILESTVNLIPPAWQYPEITQSRIVFNEQTYSTLGFKEGPFKQTADIVVKGEKQGTIEVVYREKKPILDEGPFLKEERNLLNTISKELAVIIERKQSELEEQKLQAQLRHADRLATVGQLASGVAHELNEPLGNILGFAQLAKKSPELPKQAGQDIEKIINASLHAREIVKKLLIFSRQMPTMKIKVDLSPLVKEGLYFLQSRCVKEGIELNYSLAQDLPEIIIDPSQLKQIVVNLVVNAIQAMPGGGKLDVQTQARNDHISLIVEDTGIGMSKEVLKQIFVPFFTTKDIGEGTGLGLSVVHGIVSSHGGSIEVDSTVGMGSRFEIRLPLAESTEKEDK